MVRFTCNMDIYARNACSGFGVLNDSQRAVCVLVLRSLKALVGSGIMQLALGLILKAFRKRYWTENWSRSLFLQLPNDLAICIFIQRRQHHQYWLEIIFTFLPFQ